MQAAADFQLSLITLSLLCRCRLFTSRFVSRYADADCRFAFAISIIFAASITPRCRR